MDLLKIFAIGTFLALCAVTTIARAPAGYASEGAPRPCGEIAQAGHAILDVIGVLSGDDAGALRPPC